MLYMSNNSNVANNYWLHTNLSTGWIQCHQIWWTFVTWLDVHQSTRIDLRDSLTLMYHCHTLSGSTVQENSNVDQNTMRVLLKSVFNKRYLFCYWSSFNKVQAKDVHIQRSTLEVKQTKSDIYLAHYCYPYHCVKLLFLERGGHFHSKGRDSMMSAS